MKAATVVTHRRVAETALAMRELIAAARRAGVVLRFTEDETLKYKLVPGEGVELNSTEVDRSVPQAGPKTPTGFTTESSRPLPSRAMKSQAARSARVFDLT